MSLSPPFLVPGAASGLLWISSNGIYYPGPEVRLGPDGWDLGNYKFQVSGDTYLSGQSFFKGNTISGLADPIYPSAATSKHYVDTNFYPSSHGIGHSSNADIHFPSSNLLGWLNALYQESGTASSSDVAWSGASGFYSVSSNYIGHSSNKSIHSPSSNLKTWFDNVYEPIGASGTAWSGATGYVGHSGNASVHVSTTEDANWTQAYNWVNTSSNRYENILASGNEYTSAYQSGQRVKDSFDHELYIASSTAISRFADSSNYAGHSSNSAIHFTSGQLDGLWYPSSLGRSISSQVWGVYNGTYEPTGFITRDTSTLYWEDVNRKFAISANNSTFDYYYQASKKTTSSSNIIITDTNGLHYIYFSANGNITEQVNPSLIDEWTIFQSKPLVSIIYWNKSSQTAPYVGEERHGIIMDGRTHVYLHYTEGLRYFDGLALNSISSNESGDVAGDAQFGVDTGTVVDEDIAITSTTINSTTGLPIYYRSGTSGIWFKETNAGFSVRTAGTGRLAWNENIAGTWSLSEVDDKDFALSHVFGTTEKDNPMIVIMGQDTYDKKKDAREGATTEVNNLLLGNLPGPEIRAIATVIFETKNGYGNAVKGRIVTTDEDDDYVDWRTTSFGRGTAASDHGSLGGLSDDDHTQYYDSTRLDAYISKASSSAIWASSNLTKFSSNATNIYLELDGSNANQSIDINNYNLFAGGLHATGNSSISGNLTVSGQIVSMPHIGTAPIIVSSQTLVSNLNADMLDGKHVGTVGNTVPLLDGTNDWSNVQEFQTDIKLQFRDTGIFIHSNADGELTIEADTLVTIGVVGDTELGDGTLRDLKPNTDGKMSLGNASKRFSDLYLKPYTDITRGAAGNEGRVIFNSDDGNLNIDDGAQWILPDGGAT